MLNQVHRHRSIRKQSNRRGDIPDLPGCVATGETAEEAENQIREAIEYHLNGMREDGLPLPVPQSTVEYVEVAA